MKVAPAIVSVPVRPDVDVFAATENSTLAGPDPEAPLVTVIHAALLVALQPHPAPAVTPVLPVPPAAVNDCAVDETLYEQVALACVTVNVLPAIVSVPERPVLVDVFAATLKPTLLLPDPDAPLVTVIHDALLTDVHAHPGVVVTALLPVPAEALNDCADGEML